MELNTDNIFNIDIDPQLLKSYEKPSLEHNPQENLHIYCEEGTKNDDFLPDNSEDTSLTLKEYEEIDYIKNCSDDKKLSIGEMVQNTLDKSDKNNLKNVNETSEIDENLNELFSDLKISNVKNNTDVSQLKERHPDRVKKNKDVRQSVYSRYNIDTSGINKEKLRFLSGSTICELNDSSSLNISLSNDLTSATYKTGTSETINTKLMYSEYANDITKLNDGEKILTTEVLNSDLFYEDTAVIACSPNNSISSGYETCSPQSFSSSPPKYVMPTQTSYLESSSENFNEQDILDGVVELECITNCVRDSNISLVSKLSDQDHIEKVIIDFLKENQFEKVDIISSSNTDNRLLCNYQELDNLFKSNENNLNSNEVSDFYSNITSEVAHTSPHCKGCIKSVFTSCCETDSGFSLKLDLNNTLNSKNAPKIPFDSKPPIACEPFNDVAKKKLRKCLRKDKFYEAAAEIYRKMLNAEKVICIADDGEKLSKNQTNLHLAVLNGEMEKVYCLVEIHKQYHDNLSEINIRDKQGKTALDYAMQEGLTNVVEYLEEKNGCPGIKI